MDAYLSRAQGCLMGLVCGNSLGCNARSKTEEELKQEFPEGIRDISGHSTNNIELTTALARAIIRGKGYDKNKALQAYLDWYSTSPSKCGKTIAQALSSGGKFKNHQSMASGALKRTPVIALAGFGDEPSTVVDNARQDASLTHPNSMCLEVNMLFTAALSFALNKPGTLTADMVFNEINAWAYKLRVSDIIFKAVQASKFDLPEDYITKQGFVLIPLQNAMWHLLHTESAEEALIQTVLKGGNTDTNAGLCGALFGAVYGVNIFPERWRQAVLNPQGAAEEIRPERYLTADILHLADSLLNKKWTEVEEEKTEEDPKFYTSDTSQAPAAADSKKAEELEDKELELIAKARALTAKEATLTSLAESLEKREEELKKSLTPQPKNAELTRELDGLKEENNSLKTLKEALERELDTLKNTPPPLPAGGDMAEKEQALAEKERDLRVLEADMARREDVLGRQGERIELKERELVEKSTELNLKIQELKNEQAELAALKENEKHTVTTTENADKEEELILKEQSLNERLEALRERESALKDSEKNLREREQTFKSTEVQNADMEASAASEEFAKREEELAAREAELVKKEERLVAEEDAFALRASLREDSVHNEELEREGAFKQREEDISAREAASALREEDISAREAAFASREETISAREAALTAKEEEFAAKEASPREEAHADAGGGGSTRQDILREVAAKLIAKSMLSKIITDVTGLSSEELDKLRGA